MNQAEHRLQAAEVREAELVLLATPSEQVHFGAGRRCLPCAMAWSGRGARETSRWSLSTLNLNQSQGGMYICRKVGIVPGELHQCLGP